MNTTEKRINDLKALVPEQKVLFLLSLVNGLRDRIVPTIENNQRQREFLAAVDEAVRTGSPWANGQAVDGNSLLYPVYNDEAADVADLELEEHEAGFSQDSNSLGSLATTVLLYAANIQLRREGVKHLPQPFQTDFNDELLVEYLEVDRDRLAPAFKATFDRLWEARFRPTD